MDASVSELRHDPLTGTPVICAPLRGERPQASAPLTEAAEELSAEAVPGCPFCPVHEPQQPLVLVLPDDRIGQPHVVEPRADEDLRLPHLGDRRPCAPCARCRRATAMLLCVLACGRSATPFASASCCMRVRLRSRRDCSTSRQGVESSSTNMRAVRVRWEAVGRPQDSERATERKPVPGCDLRPDSERQLDTVHWRAYVVWLMLSIW